VSDFIQRLQAEQAAEDAERESWSLGDYTATGCENCGRMRVCSCPNGKHRCEKCNWCPEDHTYAPVSML
jgi:hypothetical protein